MFKLETQRLILRDMQPADAEAFVSISQESKYQRFYSESDCAPDKYRQLTQLFIVQASEQPRTAYQLAIEYKTTGEFIGTVGLRLEADSQASMGCGMARAYQGNGLIHEAAYSLMNVGFRELGVHRIYAETISQNRAAIRLCKALGMRQEGYFREHRFFKDQWWDTVVLAALQSEWK
ncbi:GNAT family N-acetyltransferase [Aeromonas veronii]|uniref:GNAT family N-acetyltransferase n=1 Tax=Aeromonas veronii TaxID=654 RepID=UPI003F7B3A48